MLISSYCHTQGSVCLTGSRASKSELLLTCPTPPHRDAAAYTGQSKCTDSYLWFSVYMVLSNTKVANIGQQGKRALLCFCIWFNQANHNSDSSAMTDYRCKFSTLDQNCKLNQLRWQNMSAYLTNEISYWQKKLLMHPNWAICNAWDLNIDLHVCFFPDFVTGLESASPDSTARGLSTMQRGACICLLNTQKPKRLPRVFLIWFMAWFFVSQVVFRFDVSHGTVSMWFLATFRIIRSCIDSVTLSSIYSLLKLC